MHKRNKNLVCLSVLLLMFSFCIFLVNSANAYYDCSQYGSFAYSDGSGYCKCMSGYVWDTNIVGDKSCVSCSSKYGYGAISDYLTGSCKCRSGYVWGTDFLGERKCVSGNSECSDQYGYGATYDSLSEKCKCRSGYIWGEDFLGNNKCITESQYCKDNYGYNSRFNSLTDKCECGYGYEFTLKSFGNGLECESCFSKYGLHSSYNALIKKCECDSDYTLDEDNKCVEKQNNVYFLLKELDTDDKQAVIRSNYDYAYYLVTYGAGCYSSSIKRYLNSNIVINLGTDFNVDIGDKIVLYDDSETCEIRKVKKVNSSYSLIGEEVILPVTSPTVKGTTFTAPVILEGALIRATNGIDIYIVKYVGTKKFKRLVLSPSVFNNYGHLRWGDVINVSQTTLDSFTTSELVRAVGDDKIYRLYPQGDSGQKRLIKNSSILTRLGLDADSIYEINSFDRESYITGAELE